MMYTSVKLVKIESDEIQELICRTQDLTRGGYDLYDQNYKVLVSLLKRLLRLTRQEKEWHLYFYTLYELMYLYARNNNYAEIVKYAELYYKDSALYMDRELPNYPDTNMAYINVWTYDKIFEAYYEYYQIDDAKMEAFMKRYEEAALKYGKTYLYYKNEISLSILYLDRDRMERAVRNFLFYEKEMKSCYVCGHLPYLRHFLLVGQEQRAEELMLDYIHKNIPQKHVWCYKYCQNAEPDSMYLDMIGLCVDSGNVEKFQYFYEKYWMKLPLETRLNDEACSFQRLLAAYDGCFDKLDKGIEQAAEDIREENDDTTVHNMNTFLEWWCYFILLDRNGVHKVSVKFPELETDAQGQVSTLAVSDYMQAKADLHGNRFAQARAQFDYRFAKESYRKCFLQENDGSRMKSW